MNIWFPVATALIFLIGQVAYHFRWVLKQEDLPEELRDFPEAVKQGSQVYLLWLYGILLALSLVFSVALTVIFDAAVGIACFSGASFAALAGFLSMSIAVRANSRVFYATARQNPGKAFDIAYSGGKVMGYGVVTFSLLGVSIFFGAFRSSPILENIVTGFSFGYSLFALLACAGGGIFTKIADVGADLVGKVEKAIPEDDPRNPAVMADQLGDNVGDVAGRGADGGDSLCAALIATLIIGLAQLSLRYHALPLNLVALGLWSSFLGMRLPKLAKRCSPGLSEKSLIDIGVFSTGMILAGLIYALVYLQGLSLGVFFPAITGVAVALLVGYITKFLTGEKSNSVYQIAQASRKGPAFTMLEGEVVRLNSVNIPVIAVAMATCLSWYSALAFGIPGEYGIAIAGVGMLSISAVVLTSDASGPIFDNAAGIAEVLGYNGKVRRELDRLDAVGNTNKCFTKMYCVCSAGLSIIGLLLSYAQVAGITIADLSLLSPVVLAGVLLGMMLPSSFAAILIKAVTEGAQVLVDEIRRQFQELFLLEEPEATPDYKRCVTIITMTAYRSLVKPTLVAIGFPVILGLLFGARFLGACLMGVMARSVFLAISMTSAGAAWDNAKKFIEADIDNYDKETHEAAVIGDLFGDPLKDTAGSALETLTAKVFLLSILLAGSGLMAYALLPL